MRLFYWRKNRHRGEVAKLAADESEKVHDRIVAQWPEVLALAKAAREQREMNHLSQLFFDLRGGKSQ